MFKRMFCQNFRSSLKTVTGYISEFNHSINCSIECFTLYRYNTATSKYLRNRLYSVPVNTFSTEKLPKNANVFGDISGRKFEHVEMDELEEKEEKFQDSEVYVSRQLKPSTGQYAKMIKSYISKNDLNLAVKVLDIVKENRDKSTMYMYNLLLNAFARQGDIKQCFKLYNKAKKHSLQPNAATYTSLFNACAVSENTEVALEQLNKLRHSLYGQQFPLNETHYNVMVKAYSWHNKIIEAFELVDEMIDKQIPIGEITYNSLLHGAISDKEAGLRHALTVWHLMRRKNIKPSLTTYNLLLRAIRDTNFGNLKLDDILVAGYEKTKITLTEGERPNLLISPPVVSTLLPLTEKAAVSDKNNKNCQIVPSEKSIYLNDVLAGSRLILFGGLEGFLDQMAIDNIKPHPKTVTLFLDLIPNTIAAENLLMKIIDVKSIQLDTDFYNMLIKRRSMRFEYKTAKEVLSIMEQKRLSPNIMTFGVLALGCQESTHVKEFLEGLEAFGYKPNAVIMSTLIKTACCKNNFEYLLYVMNYMVKNSMTPNAQAVQDLTDFSKSINNIEKPTGKYKYRKLKRLEENIEKFEKGYPKWQRLIKDDSFCTRRQRRHFKQFI